MLCAIATLWNFTASNETSGFAKTTWSPSIQTTQIYADVSVADIQNKSGALGLDRGARCRKKQNQSRNVDRPALNWIRNC